MFLDDNERRQAASQLSTEGRCERVKSIQMQIGRNYVKMCSEDNQEVLLNSDEINELEEERSMLLTMIAADPAEFSKMRIWMLEICGTSESKFDASWDGLPDTEVLEHIYEELSKADKFAAAVVAFLRGCKVPVRSSSGEGYSWAFGMLCTAEEYDKLYGHIRLRFTHLLKNHIITLHRYFWDFRVHFDEVGSDDSSEVEFI